MTQKERMLTGKLYTWDEELARDHARKDELISRLSAASPGARESLFHSLFGHIGKDFHIELPFQCDYGSHIYIGDRFYANFDCIILDVDLPDMSGFALCEKIRAKTGLPIVFLSGYTEDEIANLLTAIAGDGDSEADGVDDEVPPPQIPMSRPGDLWLLGEHRVICGSATDRATVERLMDGKLAHCVFTDPPYGVSYVSQSGKFEMLENDNLTEDSLVQELILPAFRHAVAFTIDDAAFYIWHSSSRRQDFYYAMTAAGLLERQTIIWAKNGIALGHADYQWAHEPCFYCSKGENAPRFFGDRAQHTVWRVTRRESGTMETTISGGITITDGAGSKMHITEKPPKDKKSRYLRVEKGKGVYLYSEGKENTLWEVNRETGTEHPTQKPVELAQRAIENSTQEGEIVLDLFGGMAGEI